jgi:hypothetical protein
VVTAEGGVGGGRFTPLGVAWCPPEVCVACVSIVRWLLSVQGVFWDSNGLNRGQWGGALAGIRSGGEL